MGSRKTAEAISGTCAMVHTDDLLDWLCLSPDNERFGKTFDFLDDVR
jgi:hypothetical protein